MHPSSTVKLNAIQFYSDSRLPWLRRVGAEYWTLETNPRLVSRCGRKRSWEARTACTWTSTRQGWLWVWDKSVISVRQISQSQNPQVPTSSDSKLLPVLVWIHGGAFALSFNNATLYGPTFLLDKDVLLVAPNYRLGAFGFLSTGDASAAGNWGLKDQILALKWVKKNIKYFGGDRNRVTVAGSSAGSMSTEILALSKSTDGETLVHFSWLLTLTKKTGLFHRYICQSGVSTSPIVYQGEPAKRAAELGNHLGCPTDSSALLIECLRKTDASKIIDATKIFSKWEIFPMTIWLPAVEPDVEGAVLTDTPVNLLKRGRIRDLPAIAGSVRDDGFILSSCECFNTCVKTDEHWSFVSVFYMNPDKFQVFLDDFDHLAPYVLGYYDKSKNESAITSALKSFYFNNDLTANRTEVGERFSCFWH